MVAASEGQSLVQFDLAVKKWSRLKDLEYVEKV